MAPPPLHAQAGAASLVRRLGPYDAAAIVISNVIGGGIFFVPIIVAQLVPDPLWMLAVWLFGGALAMAGAMAYAELAAVRPHAGGEYVYLRDAFGPLAAFLTGWTSFVAGFSGAIAASAVALADYVLRFFPGAAGARSLIAIAAIGALTLIHVRGLGPGRVVQNVLAALKVSAILLIVAAGFAIGQGDAGNFGGPSTTTAVPWLLALVPVMFSYSGWNAASYVAEEVRDPSRNVPLALGLGTVAVIVIYLALNALYLFAMPLPQVAALGDGRLMDTVAERLFGFATGNLIALFTIVSLAASMSAMILAGPRVYFAMARDGIFMRAAGRVHPRFHTPATAILAQAVWSSVLVLSGTLSQLVNYTGFAVVLFSGLAVAALFVLRRREPNAERPYRTLGYPIVPGLYALVAAIVIVNGLVRDPGPTGAGALIILAGIPLYFFFKRKA